MILFTEVFINSIILCFLNISWIKKIFLMNIRLNKYNIIAFFVFFISIPIFCILLVKYWNLTFDDSFITFRYSKMMALGFGPRFNPSGIPEEGYTSFLWMLIMVVPHLIGGDAIVFSKIVGILFFILSMCFVFLLIKTLIPFIQDDLKNLFASLGILLIILFRGNVFHIVTGMETSLFAFLLVLFAYINIRFLREKKRNLSVILFITGFLIGITRPEGNLYVLVASLSTFFFLNRQEKIFYIKNFILFYVLPGLGYFSWRWWYYGNFLPLPFYIKIAGRRSYFAGLKEVLGFLNYFSFTLVFLLLGTVMSWKKTIPVFTAISSMIFFFIYPRHIMGLEWRFLNPVCALMIVFIMIGLGYIYEKISAYIVSKNVRLILIVLVIAVTCYRFLLPLPMSLKYARGYSRGLKMAHIKLGKVLNKLSDKNFSKVVAVGDAGAVPYFSMWKTIDTYGLNDVYIAMTGNHNPDYIFRKKPDIVVLISFSSTDFIPHLKWELDIYTESIRRGYSKVKLLVFSERNYFLWVMADPNTEIGRKLSQWY